MLTSSIMLTQSIKYILGKHNNIYRIQYKICIGMHSECIYIGIRVYVFECMYRICVSVYMCRGTDIIEVFESIGYSSVCIRVFECMYSISMRYLRV